MIHKNIILKRTQQREISRMNLKLVLFSFFILPLVACPLWGQVMQKKRLTTNDYDKWGEMFADKASSDGKWISYKMTYENEKDTLFVRNTQNLKTYNIPKGTFPLFAGSKHFICKDKKSRYILNLTTGQIQEYPISTKIDYSFKSDQIIIFSKEKSILQLLNLTTNAEKTFNDVTGFQMSPNGNKILLSKKLNHKYSIGILTLDSTAPIEWIALDKTFDFTNFKWEANEKAVAFYSFSDVDLNNTGLYVYILENKKLSVLNSKTNEFPTDKILDKNMTYALNISPDLQRVFFGLAPKEKPIEKSKDSVEIWNTADRWIYPLEKKSGRFSEKPSLAVWHLDSDHIVQITSAQFPKVMLTGDMASAIVFDPKAYEPQFEPSGPSDFYLLNINTGEKEIIIEKQDVFKSKVLPSPSGKYITYFKDLNFYIYNIMKKTHTNITKNIKTSFFGRIMVLYSESGYGNVGWSTDEDEILLYDQYDIWAIKPDGEHFRRLTRGRENKIKYRLNTRGDFDLYTTNYDGYKSNIFNFKDQLILRAEGDDSRSGYYTLNKNKLSQIIYKDSYINNLQYSPSEDLFIYCEQRFDLAPRLMIKKSKSLPKVVFQSNLQDYKYFWGRSELLHYRNSKGKELKGVLYYPANYDPNKQYPMIVQIYEVQSTAFHHYYNPTLYSPVGYNPSVLTSKGYFVLCPDIIHETGTVGENSLDCTVSGVQHVINRNIIDPKKIGLFGHSFGGYETNFIITQTNLFAAAISGGSITDLTSFYFNVGWALSISDMSRFQSEQWRLGKTPFEDPALYTKNSPIANASTLNTPLLIWSGKEDQHTNWNQTVEFYMALRRLGKPGKMLLYPNEMHVLTKPFNQKSHSEKVLEWFDFYLKNERPAQWINQIN